MGARYTVASALLAALLTQAAIAADVPTTPQEADEQFSHAMSLRESGEVGESIRLLQAVQAKQPKDRVKLELAVAYYRALNFSKARSLAEEVLNQPSTPESVKVTIRQFLTQIEADSKPSTFTPFVSFGYVTDSNVNAGPSRSTLDIGGTSFTLGSGSVQNGDSGLNAMVGVNHRYLFDRPLTVAGTELAAMWQSQAAYYTMSYDNKKAYDLDVVSLSTGPVLISADNWRVSVPYQVSDIYLGHSRLATFQSLNPTVLWRLGNWELSADGQYQDKTFISPQNAGRNSDVSSEGIAVGRTYQGGRYGFAVTARAFNEVATDIRFSNKGDDYGVILTARPWDGWDFAFRHNYRSTNYNGVEPLYNVARREHEERSSLGANYAFRGGVMDSWTLGLITTVTRNHSNVSIYDYSRIQTGLTLGRSF
ncbi:MAG TPA: hypothetical protein VFW68_02645 [Rhodocyclaceae bacterium]|nr:hypothetical protein [Rhodocyclaceae bacterium]